MKKLISFLFLIIIYSQLPAYNSLAEYLIDGLKVDEQTAVHSYAIMLQEAWKSPDGIAYFDFTDQEEKLK